MDNGTPAPSAPQPAGRSLLRRSRPAIVLVLLFSFGLAIGKWAIPSRKAAEKKTEEPVAHLETPEHGLSPLDLRKKADRLLIAGSPVQALEWLAKIKPDGRRVAAAHVNYRAALCQEILGRNELAMAGYRQAGNEEGAEGMRPAILLGQARLLFLDKRFAEARTLVQGLTLDEQDRESPALFRHDARMLVALSLAAEHLGDDPSHLLGGIDAERVFAAYRYADDLPPFAISKDEKKLEEKEQFEARLEEGKEPQVKAVRCVRKDAVTFFDALATVSGHKIEWSEKAKKRAAERQLTIVVENWSVAELAQRAADSIEQVCEVQKNVLRLRAPEELSAAEFAAHREAFAERMLQAVLRSEPEHAGAGLVMLRLSELGTHRKKPAEAETWLKRLVAEQPYSHWATAGHFGLATMRFQEGNLSAARRHLFQAIDLSPGNDASAQAYVQIGQTYLEEGDASLAARHLRRAHALGVGSALLPRATLLSVSAHLVLDEPEVAQKLIATNRAQLRKGDLERSYAFLNALTQFRAAKAQRMGRRESRDLYESAKALGDDALLGRWGRYLQVQAFLDMNLPLEALPLAETALATARGPIADPLRYAHAEALLHASRKEEAAKDFSMLESSGSDPWKERSMWQLAQLDSEFERTDACLLRCRQLWREDSPYRKELLQVWGEAWRRKGDFAKAAKAFGGQPPE